MGLSALLVKVDEDQLLANALVEQGVGRRRADIAGANNHHFTGFGVHIQISKRTAGDKITVFQWVSAIGGRQYKLMLCRENRRGALQWG